MHRGPNRQVRLKSRPSGIPRAEHFEIVDAPAPAISDGQVLVRNIYLSVENATCGLRNLAEDIGAAPLRTGHPEPVRHPRLHLHRRQARRPRPDRHP
jgi:NADPH-dependent curcumin reductase CurA